jgi:hypothetical protein
MVILRITSLERIMQMHLIVKEHLLAKAPELYQSLLKSGGLNEFVLNLAQEISSEVVDLTQAQRFKEHWDKLGPLECAARMKMANALNREIVIADMLEFPPEETSPPRQD